MSFFNQCKHNVDFLGRKPNYLIIGIKPDGKINLPPTFENVQLVAGSRTELLEKIKSLSKYRVYEVSEEVDSPEELKKELDKFIYDTEQQKDLEIYESIKKKYNLE